MKGEGVMQQDPHGIDQHSPGAKLDAGKAPMRLIMHAMPRALLAVGKVGAYGAVKYSENGWLEVPQGVSRYTDAMFRHALLEGIEARDAESGLLHAAQVAWNALARLELMLQQAEPVPESEDGKAARLEQAIRKTLDDNLHLADGEICTLIDLKRVVPDWRMPDA